MESPADKKSKLKADTDHKIIKVFANTQFTRQRRVQDRNKSGSILHPQSEISCSPESKPQIIQQNPFKDFCAELGSKLNLSLQTHTINDLVNSLSKKMNNIINCTIQDLHEGVRILLDIIEKYEKSFRKTGKLLLGSHEFILKINGKDMAITSKDKIAGFLNKDWLSYTEKLPTINNLPNSIIKMCEEYEESMLLSYNEKTQTPTLINSCRKINYTSQCAIEMQLALLKQSKNDQVKLKNDLEWQNTELKIAKSTMKHKKNELQDEINYLKSKRIDMVNEWIKAEKESEKVNKKKDVLEKVLEKLNRFFEEIEEEGRGKVELVQKQSEEKGSGVEKEIEELEVKLRELDKMLRKCSKDEMDQINTQIYRVKTKISGLKSISAINGVMNMRKNAKNAMNNLNRVYSIDHVKSKTPIKRYSATQNSPISEKNENVVSSVVRGTLTCNSYNSTLKTDRSSSVDCELEDTKPVDFEKTLCMRGVDRLNASPKKDSKPENFYINIFKKKPIQDIKKIQDFKKSLPLDINTIQMTDSRDDIEKMRHNAIEKELEYDMKLKDLKMQKIKLQEERGRIMAKIYNLKHYLQECCDEISQD
ncbi:hypothetical protein SteCoe_4060 [Stentor coeruleus]|uniref:Uncharacterized protein n=1 Tax=Stentor coeruleus TaxID=5963 RepID=A0A1R2CVH6_9CILI|nr:hypothetical protein SteCoe_4060 [Stentor coeruleus]